VLRNFADTRKAAAMLGWSAEVSLPEGLQRTVRWAALTAKNCRRFLRAFDFFRIVITL
jgi:hypothetical protein